MLGRSIDTHAQEGSRKICELGLLCQWFQIFLPKLLLTKLKGIGGAGNPDTPKRRCSNANDLSTAVFDFHFPNDVTEFILINSSTGIDVVFGKYLINFVIEKIIKNTLTGWGRRAKCKARRLVPRTFFLMQVCHKTRRRQRRRHNKCRQTRRQYR